MSYAIIRNEKLTRAESYGAYVHNDRKAKNHSNKDIDPTRTHLNFYCKENETTYIREFDRMKKEYDLQGNLRKNSIIMCQMMITSDNEFFKKIGLEETKRYFRESYKFVCNYKNLGERNIISAAVHLDETTPHMHLTFIPVIRTKDEEGNEIDKICARDFWRGRDSYRKLQNEFHKYVTAKGFDLERGLPVEETKTKHIKIEELKKITNFENTKKVLRNINLELSDVPELADINRFSIKRDEKILEKIIKPKDEIIKELYQDNLNLHRELSRQTKIIEEAEKYQKERDSIIADNKELHNQVDNIKAEYKEKEFDIEWKYKSKIKSLEKENNHLQKIVDKFYETVGKFIEWVCKKFCIGESKELVRNFEKETNTLIDPEKQLKEEEREKEWDLER